MKWLVIWVVIQTFNVPCVPVLQPPDQFGREYYSMATNAVACFEEKKSEHYEFFESIEDARTFIEAGEEENNNLYTGFGSQLKDFRIYELYVSDKFKDK
jgi:hypothetical protein